MTVTALDTKSNPESREIYSDPQARKVLDLLVRNPRMVITPEILPTDEIHYPQLDAVVGATSDGEQLLSRMTSSGVLVSDMVDQVIQCPECSSRQVSTRYLCAKCFSVNIVRSFLYEHLKCGKVANDDVFRKGDQLICPKCQSVLHNFGIEYRVVGAWYKCNECGESFNEPVHSHFCRPKHHQFNLERVRLFPIYQYRINRNALTEIRKEILLYSEALTILEDAGFTVRAPFDIIGKNGEPQTFDIVVTLKGRWGAGKMIAVDIAGQGAPVAVDLIRAFAAKIRDARPAESYLIVVPGLTEEGKALAQKLKVNFVEGHSLKECTMSLTNRGSLKEHKG
jgi:DNA-directed RNA polymerase subunit RPC12/RpoP